MAIYASPTLGHLGVLTSEAACNQATLCLVADDRLISWQWLFYKLYELRDSFNAVARGAGQQNISAEVVKNTNVLLPHSSTIQAFTKQMVPIFEKKYVCQKQNRLLVEARDRLLPKLIRGELEV